MNFGLASVAPADWPVGCPPTHPPRPYCPRLQVVVKAPMLLELSVGETLEQRAAFLTRELGLGEGELGALLARHPQVLTCTQDMLAQRITFLRDHGFNQQEIGRAVLAHPQVGWPRGWPLPGRGALEGWGGQKSNCWTAPGCCLVGKVRCRVALLRGQQLSAPPGPLQVLHYKIDSMRDRMDYLVSVGMTPKQVRAAGAPSARAPRV